MRIVLLIIIVLLLFGSFPSLPYWGPTGSPYGWYPTGGIGMILLVLIVLWLAGVF